MIARPDIFVFLASLVVIPCAFLLVPNTGDYADLRFRDGEVMQALTDSLGIQSQNSTDANAAFLLSRTQIYMGDVDGASRTLKGLVEQGADAPLLRLTLADLYASIGRQADAINLRLQVPAAELDSSTRNELANWLRYEGRHDEERTYLDRLDQAGLATSVQSTRLAFLELAIGESDGAIARLNAIDDTGELHDTQARLTLLSLLIEADRQDDAQQRAKNWQSAGEDSSFLETVQHIFRAYELEYETD